MRPDLAHRSAMPNPAEFEADIAFIDLLIDDHLKKKSTLVENNRPSMGPKEDWAITSASPMV
jgi:hypothetical protein